jgi:hypothetical protein
MEDEQAVLTRILAVQVENMADSVANDAWINAGCRIAVSEAGFLECHLLVVTRELPTKQAVFDPEIELSVAPPDSKASYTSRSFRC